MIKITLVLGGGKGRHRTQPNDGVAQTQERLAYIVLSVCAVGIALAAIVAIVAAKGDQRDGITRFVFVSTLPLFGTWVGTVLAFYFASRNLETATASTRSLTEATARLAGVATTTTLVSEKMIPRAEMKVLPLTENEAKDLEALPLKKLWDELEKISPLDRLPIIGPDGTIKALVHRSLLTGFAARQTERLPTALSGKKVSDLSEEERTLLLSTFALVPESATLGDARTRMRVVPRCHDVIVTANGAATEPVVGWLTDRDLAGLSD